MARVPHDVRGEPRVVVRYPAGRQLPLDALVTMRPDCRDCTLIERRTFLREAGVLLAGLVAALGGAPETARALTVTFGRALSSTGEEHDYAIPAEDGAMIDRDTEVIVVR